MFPHIQSINDLLPHIGDNKQIRVKQEPNGATVVCYMLQDEDTFAGQSYEYERECRGITFNERGEIAARTLHKFFNVGEREDTQPHALEWSKIVRIMDKRDGSMVTPLLVGGDTYAHVQFKTKKSFATKEAQLAAEIAAKTPRGLEWITGVLRAGFTPTFEVTSPRFPIVLKYDKDELTLLHVRDNVTGKYLRHELFATVLGVCPFPVVENLIDQFYADGIPAKLVSWEKMKAEAETREGIEGWIIQFESGDMVKLKTKWYCELHHAVTFTRWRDIARAVVGDTADDLKGAFAMTGRSIDPIIKVEREIKHFIESTKLSVEHIVAQCQGKTPKEVALTYNNHELFGLIMSAFRGKQIDYYSWYEKDHLDKQWGLEVVA